MFIFTNLLLIRQAGSEVEIGECVEPRKNECEKNKTTGARQTEPYETPRSEVDCGL